jgi:hypothetical protein
LRTTFKGPHFIRRYHLKQKMSKTNFGAALRDHTIVPTSASITRLGQV